MLNSWNHLWEKISINVLILDYEPHLCRRDGKFKHFRHASTFAKLFPDCFII